VTLGVAAVFPWSGLIDSWPESLRRVLEAMPQFRPAPAIVMASDTRWTYKVGTDFEDGAVKVVALSRYALAIYAGDTEVGPRALGSLTDRLASRGEMSCARVVQEARASLSASWRRFALPDSRSQVCIGVFHKRDGLRLWRFDSSDGFRPRESAGIETIGSDSARLLFWQNLREEVSRQTSKPLSESAFGMDKETWGTVLSIALWRTCKSGLDETIGGPLLLGHLTQTGVQGRSLHAVDLDMQTSQQLTLNAVDAEEFQLRQRREFGGAEAFGIPCR